MKKRLLSALCAVMLLICAVPMASAQTGDAARRADALTVLHLLSEDPSRDLTKPATRAQAAVLLVRLAGGEKKPDTDGWFAGFRDVPDWARTAVNYANRRGWISGVSNVQFDPNGHLNADAWCAMLLRMLGYSDKTGDFEISDAAAFAWRIGLTGRQLTGILSVGDLAEAIYDALDFCYKGTETTVLSRLMDFGVCTASAANALGLLNKDYIARQLADRYLSAAFQLSLYETEEQVHDEVSSADASGFFISADGLAVTNYHSIEDSIKATATLLNGETYEVERVLYYDTGIDIAVIKVSRTNQSRRTTSAFNHLDLVGTADIRPGDPVYAIGNPLGLGLAISSGIIGSTAHELDRYALPCIVNSADISRGSSGGALAISVANSLWMLENAVYAILSPEGFASILWKDSKKAKEAAAVMKLTAADLYQMGMIEHVIPEAEPVSRENINDIAGYLENGIADFLEKYGEEEPEKLLEHRYERFRKM